MRILNAEPLRYDEPTRNLLRGVADVDDTSCDDEQGLVEALRAAEYDALLTRLGLPVTGRVLAAGSSLRWVVTPTTGLDHIDLAAAAERGIQVISLRREAEFLEGIRCTAEHTWGLLLALVRKLPAAHRDVIAGWWRREPFLGEELCGKTLGILGCGRLGRMVAGYGLAFGMKVLVHDIRPASLARAPSGVEARDVDVVLRESDVLSVHLPLNAHTHGYLSRERLRRIKRGAVLVNTARGELVDEQALVEALTDGHLAGAALDVLVGDSTWCDMIPERPAILAAAQQHDNIIITPHIGGYGRQSIVATRAFVARKLVAAMQAQKEI